MQFLRRFLDKQEKLFKPGGPLEPLYPVFEMHDTILYTPGEVTKGGSHVRDGLDLKRMMITVVLSLVPCVLWAIYNTGYQACLVVARGGAPLDDWHTMIYSLTQLGYDPSNALACFALGALHFLPVFLTVAAVGGACEVTFAIVRKHEVNEGFLVTLFLLPLTLPATIPLWQVGLGTAFGVVFGKEVFGGTGMNFLNPALTARAFLFFAYPAQISGTVWIAAESPDGLSGATWLASLAETGAGIPGSSWLDCFMGAIPGSMGETSTFLCLVGAGVLIYTGVGAWRTMFGVVLGTIAMSTLLNLVGSTTNPMMNVPFWWHMVIGGWAFATVFMATDPVSSAFTDRGRLIYGFGIGVMGILVRCINPAYPEGMMLAVLFMNLFAPLIDHFIVQGNIKRRAALYGRG